MEICRNHSALDIPNTIIKNSDIKGQPQYVAFSLCGLWAVVDLTDI